jgi:hypothetical protein
MVPRRQAPSHLTSALEESHEQARATLSVEPRIGFETPPGPNSLWPMFTALNLRPFGTSDCELVGDARAWTRRGPSAAQWCVSEGDQQAVEHSVSCERPASRGINRECRCSGASFLDAPGESEERANALVFPVRSRSSAWSDQPGHGAKSDELRRLRQHSERAIHSDDSLKVQSCRAGVARESQQP